MALYQMRPHVRWPYKGLEQIILIGQSLAGGAHGVPVTRNAKLRQGNGQYMMFNGGVYGYHVREDQMTLDMPRMGYLVPFEERQNPSVLGALFGETILTGFIGYLQSKMHQAGITLLGNTGVGSSALSATDKVGTPITSLTYSAPYATLVTGEDWAGAGGTNIGDLSYMFVKGASDPRFNGYYQMENITDTYTWRYIPDTAPGASATGAYLQGPQYSRVLNQVRRARQLMPPGIPHNVGALLSVSGEGDGGNSNYDSEFDQLRDDYIADIGAILGKTANFPILHSQPSSYFGGARNGPLDMKYLHDVYGVNKHICVCPQYFLPHHTDDIHLTPDSYLRLGEYYGRAYWRHINGLSPVYSPCRPYTVVASGTKVTVTYRQDVIFDPDGGITDPREQTGNSYWGGVNIYNSGDLTIISGRQVSSRVIEFITSVAASGSSYYRIAPNNGTYWTGSGPTDGPRSILRLDQPTEYGPLSGQPMHEWAAIEVFGFTP